VEPTLVEATVSCDLTRRGGGTRRCPLPPLTTGTDAILIIRALVVHGDEAPFH
jgi:hypothetical protein